MFVRRDDLVVSLKEERWMIAKGDQGDQGEISRQPNLWWPTNHYVA